MKKLILTVLLSAIVGGHPSFAVDQQYYYQHPGEIQAALLACPQQAPQGVDCETLSQIAKKTSEYLLELERNPQGFGLQILQMQAQMAQVTADESLRELQQELAARMALIRLLERPEVA